MLSEPAPVLSGVPQGSSLGPLLFLIHISDISNELQYVSASSFADDTRLILRVQEDGDRAKMQTDLLKIYQWAQLNNMKFNGKKFELLRYGGTEVIGDYLSPESIPIKEVSEVRDLGIHMNCSANFSSEIENVISKSNRQAGWVLRVFKTRQPYPMMTLYKAMIRPHLEYCCQLWSPITAGAVRRLEGVQRSFTARIAGISHLNYWDRLKRLEMFSLERRRERYQVIYVFKIIQKLVPNFECEKFKVVVVQSERRGRLCKIPPINTGASARLKTMSDSSFAVRGPRLFNKLPIELRNFEGSVDAFKARLDKELRKIPDQPCILGYHQPATSNSLLEQIRTGGSIIP